MCPEKHVFSSPFEPNHRFASAAKFAEDFRAPHSLCLPPKETMTNKFVSFLETAGKVIADAALVWTGAGPLFTNLFPAKSQSTVTAVGNDLQQVASVVTQVEATFAAVSSAPTGTLKLQAAVPQVAAIVQAALGFTKDAIANPTLYNQGVSEITQGVVDILNSVKGSAVQSNSSAAPSPSQTGAVPAPSSTVPASLTTAPVPAPTPSPATPSTLPTD